ncbi:MAG: hypothetical protein QG567_2058 [Campylobacterota bacterium]|nr:hypothetical protein [Campylobacterota bacterium]
MFLIISRLNKDTYGDRLLKVCIVCKSLLLESTLKKMLSKQVVQFNECDVVLSDRNISISKPYLLISADDNADIKKPFTHSTLLLGLERFSNTNEHKKESLFYKELELKIDKAVKDFSKNLTQIIKAHYENQ